VKRAMEQTAGGMIELPDLGATLHLGDIPAGLADELPGLYSSYFCTSAYFDLYDHPTNVNACVLEHPRHVVLFSIAGHTADILNKRIDIEPECMIRIAASLFRAFPSVRRIRTEVKFPPVELRGPARVTDSADDLVVMLPRTEDEYHAMIGNRTRKHLRQYSNQLRRKYPDFTLTVLEREQLTHGLLDQVIRWTRERMTVKGVESIYDEDPDSAEALWGLLQRHGLAVCGQIGGTCVAAQLLLHVGEDTWIHTAGFDSRYEDVHLGLLMTYFSLLESVRRGCRRTHMLFGTPVYKKRLGAEPVTGYKVSLFRSSPYKPLYAKERAVMLARDRQQIYWVARREAKRRLQSALRIVRPPAGRERGGPPPGQGTHH
jgi:hypothetical protein